MNEDNSDDGFGPDYNRDPIKTLICLLDDRALAAIRAIVREELNSRLGDIAREILNTPLSEL